MSAPRARAAAARLRVIAVAGGKGGVGKTQLAVNLAVGFGALGARVLVIDGDAGLANADLLLDVRPRSGLLDVATGRAAIEDALVASPYGVTLLAGAHGELAAARLADQEKLALLGALDSLGDDFDVVVVDTASGLGGDALFFAGAADEVVVVTTPEPTALADTYATVRSLARHHGQRSFALVVNQAADRGLASDVHERLRLLVRRFLAADVALLGWVPFDWHVHQAVMRRAPVVSDAPGSPAAMHLGYIAERILARPAAGHEAGNPRAGIQFFWRHMLGYPVRTRDGGAERTRNDAKAIQDEPT